MVCERRAGKCQQKGVRVHYSATIRQNSTETQPKFKFAIRRLGCRVATRNRIYLCFRIRYLANKLKAYTAYVNDLSRLLLDRNAEASFPQLAERAVDGEASSRLDELVSPFGLKRT